MCVGGGGGGGGGRMERGGRGEGRQYIIITIVTQLIHDIKK